MPGSSFPDQPSSTQTDFQVLPAILPVNHPSSGLPAPVPHLPALGEKQAFPAPCAELTFGLSVCWVNCGDAKTDGDEFSPTLEDDGTEERKNACSISIYLEIKNNNNKGGNEKIY